MEPAFFFLFFYLLLSLENFYKALVDRLDDPRVLGLRNVFARILMGWKYSYLHLPPVCLPTLYI